MKTHLNFHTLKLQAVNNDFSFSGLKTSVINTVHNAKQKGEEINVQIWRLLSKKVCVDCLIQNLEKAGC